MKPLPQNLIQELLSKTDAYWQAYLERLDWCHEKGPEDYKERENHPEYLSLETKEETFCNELKTFVESLASEYSWFNPFYIWQSPEQSAKMIKDRWFEAVVDAERNKIQEKHAATLKPIQERLLSSPKIYSAKELQVGKFYLDLSETPVQVTRKTPTGRGVFAGDVKLKDGYAGGYLDTGKGYKEMSEQDAKFWGDVLIEFRTAVEERKGLLTFPAEFDSV